MGGDVSRDGALAAGGRSSVATRLERVFWLGGVSATGKTTAALRLARRYDLRLYSLDQHLHEHAERLPVDGRSLDERWLVPSAGEIAAEFDRLARLRFPLVLDDITALADDAPVIVEGHALLPDLVAPLLSDPRRALFVLAPGPIQLEQIRERGDALHTRTSDPDRALGNRLERDALLAQRLRELARVQGIDVLEVRTAAETEAVVEQRFAPLLERWIARGDRGDVGSRRREMNDARLRHLRAQLASIGGDDGQTVKLSCECSRPGCAATVTLPLRAAERARTEGQVFVARDHG